ncbi:MAG: GIY-YIG nuclease family protein, partial [Candidatus Omnitrophota bacterium]
YVYIVRCRDKSLYTGVTTDVERRVKEHNAKKGGNYTRSRLPVKLVYKKTHPNRSKALKNEARVKRLTKWEKETLARAHQQRK